MSPQISAQQALALAQAGDAHAQYALGAALHQAGKLEEGVRWLRLAAASQLPEAQLALAALLVDGQGCARDLPQATDLLRPLAASHARANVLLGELHGFAALGAGDREVALRYVLAAARLGDGASLRQLGLLAACHQRTDLVRPLLDVASRLGDALAAHLLARCPAARAEELDGRVVEAALPELARDFPLPAAEVLNESPLVRRYSAAMPPLVLDALVQLASPLVRRSEIVDARTGLVRADPMRTSSHVTLSPRQHDHVLEAIEQCIARITALPALNGELVQILRYRIGEEFKPHVDYFNETGEAAYRSLVDGGQRAQTVLVYLNDGYTGGATVFPKLGLTVQGRRGDLLHFHNLDADGVGHKDSLHAGTSVTTGEKWLLSQWIRSEPYPPRVAW